jgi:hypothetical protein
MRLHAMIDPMMAKKIMVSEAKEEALREKAGP